MKVISFNIRCSNDPNGHSIDERAVRLKKILNSCDADIIGFQEAVPKWMQYIEADYSDKYDIFNKQRAENDRESVPMMWKKDKYNLLDKGWFWLSDTPETESGGWDEIYHCFRIVMWAKLKCIATGKEFVFCNTHYGFGDNGQVKSGRLIYDRLSNLNCHSIVITGDFNMNCDSPGYKEMVSHFDDVNAVTTRDFSTTYHGYGTCTDAHIDYCFVSKGTVTPGNSALLTEMFDGKYPSDHYGLLSEVEI